MTEDKYEAGVRMVMLDQMTREEGRLRADAEIREAGVERMQKDLERLGPIMPQADRKRLEDEISNLLQQIRAMRDEADVIREHARRFLDKPQAAAEKSKEYTIEDVWLTIKEHGGKALESTRVQDALACLQTDDVEEWKRARYTLQSTPWEAGADNYVAASIRVLDKLIADKRLP